MDPFAADISAAGFSPFDLVDLIDEDDPLFGDLGVTAGAVQQRADNALDAIPFVTRFDKPRGAYEADGEIKKLGQRFDKERLPEPVGPTSRTW